MLAQRSATTAGRPSLARRSQAAPAGSRRQVKAQANLFVELLASGTAGAAATAVTLITAGEALRRRARAARMLRRWPRALHAPRLPCPRRRSG